MIVLVTRFIVSAPEVVCYWTLGVFHLLWRLSTPTLNFLSVALCWYLLWEVLGSETTCVIETIQTLQLRERFFFFHRRLRVGQCRPSLRPTPHSKKGPWSSPLSHSLHEASSPSSRWQLGLPPSASEAERKTKTHPSSICILLAKTQSCDLTQPHERLDNEPAKNLD